MVELLVGSLALVVVVIAAGIVTAIVDAARHTK